ncbi:gliding motility-associated C-terminal domain-containing protein [Flavobacteriales bacterium]|nr:gliding motility-associated C-terminal domain-containing protein [Flavobacteriales bacterium]
MNIIKHYLFVFLLLPFSFSYSQEVNIFILNSSNKVDTNYLQTVYSSVGFVDINMTESNINNSLDTSNFDIAYISEGYFFNSTIQNWDLEPVQEIERQIVQNFIEEGGHVVWLAENWESGSTSESPFTTVNNIYGTIVSNGTYFDNSGYGSSEMTRIHPSIGPAGLSPTQTIFSSGSYATMVDVPNCNKLYTSDSFDFSGDVFDACTHTTLAIFPGRPKPNEGSIIISSEIGNPMKPWTVWGGAQPFTVYNTELDSSIAALHYQLIIDENTNTVNDWSDIESNMNPNCPTVTASFAHGSTNLCVGDTIIFIHQDGQSVFYTTQDTGIFRLRVYYESGTCKDDTVVFVNYTDAYVDAGLDKTICKGDEVTLSAENPSNATINWNNGVTDSIPFAPIVTKTYTVFSDKYGCISKDSVKISVSSRPELSLNIKQDTSICEGDEVILSANSSTGTTISWDNNVINNTSFNPTQSSTYKVTADNNGCVEVDSINIDIKPSPSLSIENDKNICEGELLLLNAESNGTVIWDGDFSNNTMKEVHKDGYFTAISSLNGCHVTDSLYVNIYPIPEPNFNVHYLGNSENSQQMYFENISIKTDNNFTWKLGNGQQSNAYSVEKSYTSEFDTILQIILFAENSNNCRDSVYKNIKIRKTVNEIVHVPTAFTPDDDALNDGLKPVLNFTPLEYTFSIFNRWGELIFSTDNADTYWDGTFKGNKVADGLYTYKLIYNTRILTGTVHIFK